MKKHIRKFAGMLSAVLLATAICPLIVVDKVKAETSSTRIEGTFHYNDEGTTDAENTFIYDDAFFNQTAKNYNPSLASMTMVMTMTAFAAAQLKENDYTDQTRNLYELWTKIGYKNQTCDESYKTKPTTDSIGVAAANKEIVDETGNKVTVIAVAIRGSGYEAEWASNFTIGTDRKHQGFTEAATQVKEFLKKYVADNKIAERGQQVKIWMTGFSRAAATTNLTCGMLDDEPAYLGVNVTNDNIYAYCFEPPMGGWAEDIDGKAEKYSNIFNIVNPADMVPKVAPGIMGFERYGVDMYLPSKSTDYNYPAYRDAMLNFYTNKESFSMDNYTNGTLCYDLPLQNIMLDQFMRVLGAQIAVDKPTFVSKYQSALRNLLSSLMSSPNIKKAATDVLLADGRIVDLVKAIIEYFTQGFNYDVIKNQLISIIYDIHIKAGIPITQEKVKALYEGVDDLINQLIFKENLMLGGFLGNVSVILEGHSGALCLAWLRSMDPNYVENPVQHYTDGNYRTVEVISGSFNNNFEVSLEKIDGSNKTVVAEISEDGKSWLKGDQYLICTNNYGSKRQIAVPAFENYRITIKTDQSDNIPITLKVLEYSSLTGNVKEMKTVRVTINDKRALRGKLPDKRVMQGDESEYTFDIESLAGDTYNAESVIVETLLESQIQTAVVTAATEDGNMGSISVGSTNIVGTYAAVCAEPMEGFVFTGWYEEEKLISKDQEYKFEIEKDTHLIAHFTNVETPTTETPTTVMSTTETPTIVTPTTETPTTLEQTIAASTTKQTVTQTSIESKSPTTGDYNNIFMWIGILTLALLVGGGILACDKIYNRKK